MEQLALRHRFEPRDTRHLVDVTTRVMRTPAFLVARRVAKDIAIFEPYVAGTEDQKHDRVVSDREVWFHVIMGLERDKRGGDRPDRGPGTDAEGDRRRGQDRSVRRALVTGHHDVDAVPIRSQPPRRTPTALITGRCTHRRRAERPDSRRPTSDQELADRARRCSRRAPARVASKPTASAGADTIGLGERTRPGHLADRHDYRPANNPLSGVGNAGGVYTGRRRRRHHQRRRDAQHPRHATRQPGSA